MFLDGLRGIAALYVAVYHLLAWVPSVLPRWVNRLQRPLSFGHVAVSIFIVLSGYSLGLPVARSPDLTLRGGMSGYLKRRAQRILPAYFAATAVGLLLSATLGRATNPATASVDLSPGSVLTHLFLIHNWWPTFSHTINMAHWSVAAEWQIYFIFPALQLPAWRWAGGPGLVSAGLLLAALPLVVLPANYDFHWTCPWYIGLFAIGAAASTFERAQIGQQLWRAMILLVLAMGAGYLAVNHLFYRSNVERPFVDFAKDTLAGLMVAVLLIYAVGSCSEPTPRLLIVRALES